MEKPDKYRLVLDFVFPDGMNLEQISQICQDILYFNSSYPDTMSEKRVKIMYRLQNDADRRPHNYLDLNENGHASNNKLVLFDPEQNRDSLKKTVSDT